MTIPTDVSPINSKVLEHYRSTISHEKPEGTVLRFSEVKDADGDKTGVKTLSLKPHGIFSRAIRLFFGPTKQDAVENREIRQQYYNEFTKEHPILGHKIMEATGFIKLNPETKKYEIASPKPLTVGDVYKFTKLGRNYEKNDFHIDRKDPLKIL